MFWSYISLWKWWPSPPYQTLLRQLTYKKKERWPMKEWIIFWNKNPAWSSRGEIKRNVLYSSLNAQLSLFSNFFPNYGITIQSRHNVALSWVFTIVSESPFVLERLVISKADDEAINLWNRFAKYQCLIVMVVKWVLLQNTVEYVSQSPFFSGLIYTVSWLEIFSPKLWP